MNEIDLFLEKKVKNLIDSFSYCFKVRITIFSVDLQEKLAVGFYPTCSYCKLIREELGYKNHCLQQDRKMSLRSLNSHVPLSYVCHAGLVDSVFPIKPDETAVIGYAMIGQFRTQNAIPAAILRAWEKNGFDPAVLKTAFAEQVFFGQEALENMLNLFSMLCDFIVSKGYIRLRRFDIIEEILRWVESHISKPILFSEVADYLGYSQSTILNVLKKRLNMNFKQLCILKKIERFETVAADNPTLSIEEAALKVGYSDVSYFSRLYKKVRSTTPSAFVKSIRNNPTPSLVSQRNI
ncbi:MAG: PocR ligand-binding domain-containing protein [Treponema sp.]|jgi:AraC-like DNA-binding protein/ligand-binding sensor protein|nr:PocR ligand-binding domain-containing protein [Treponema sp.]